MKIIHETSKYKLPQFSQRQSPSPRKLLTVIEVLLTPAIIALLYNLVGAVFLLSSAFLIFLTALKLGWIRPQVLGLNTANIKGTKKAYFQLCLLTLLGLTIIKLIGVNFDKRPIGLNLIWLVLLSATVQELYYRGYLLTRLKTLSQNKFFLILFTSFLFGLLHLLLMPVIHYNFNLVIASFLLSLIWTSVYLNYSNLYLMILLHFINNLGLYFIILT